MIVKNLKTTVFIAVASIFGITCSDSNDMLPCDSSSTILGNNICIVFEHNELSSSQKNLLTSQVALAVDTINKLLPIENLEIRFVQNSMIVVPEIGIGGYNPNHQEVVIAIDINFDEINSIIEKELLSLLAHEIHHVKRRRSVGYGSTLLQAAISEGLADHFSIQLTEINPPPWSLAIGGAELEEWINIASNSWNESSYSHDAWFRGTDPNIPKWAGYAIGFELTKNFLVANPDKVPSTLFDEPAASFEP